jgi:hypothetical protein
MKRVIIGIAVGVMMGGMAFAGSAMSNSLDREYWLKQGASVDSLIEKQMAPTGKDQVKSFEAVSWIDGKKTANFADQYVQRLVGYLVPKVSGDYVFWIAGDDYTKLLLSTDANPANKKQIAENGMWTGPHQWTKYPSQKSKAVTLTAGQVYYIEGQHREGGGGDCFAVGWSKPGESQDTASEVVPGDVLSALSAGVPSK